MSKIKIAVLYICTGRYEKFWADFYTSAEKFLLPSCQKHYFVFTDAKSILDEESPFVNKIYQENLPWPYPTLYRFKFFNKISSSLESFDFIYFFNANIKICKTIHEDDILPTIDEDLVVTQHPGYWNKPVTAFTYETNPASKAFVPVGTGSVYVAGGLNGGSADKYLKFIKTAAQWIEEDENNKIMAIWHDESHLNKYILDKKVKILHPGYLYPEDSNLPFEKIIHLSNKKKTLKGYGKYSLKEKLLRKLLFFKRPDKRVQ